MRRRASTAAFVLCVAAAAASLAVGGDAFAVTSEPVRATQSSDANRALEQRYLVSQPLVDSVLNRETLQTLKIAIPGRVFVSYNYDLRGASAPPSVEWPSPAATVRLSGNSEDIFGFFEVVSTAPHTVEVRRRADAHGMLHDAYLLTEISLSQSHALREIVTTGSAELIVEDQVLVADGQSPLSLELSGSSNVYVDSRSSPLTASVHVASRGSGELYWTTGALQTQSFKLELAGSGDVSVFSQALDTTSVEVAIAGSGDVCVDAADIKTNSLSTATAGSGTISFSAPSGHCNHEDISILGAGDVYVGAIQCNDVKVTVAGAGDIYVQAVHSITGSAWGAGDIKYVGVTPQLISDRYDSSVYSKEQSKKYHPIAKFKAKNKHTNCTAKTVPLRAAVHVHGSFWAGAMGGSGPILAPLVFFALLSLCYLRCQRKRPRRDRRVPRFASYRHQPSAQELQPLQPQQYPQAPYQPQHAYHPQAQQPYQPQAQHQQQSGQVYV